MYRKHTEIELKKPLVSDALRDDALPAPKAKQLPSFSETAGSNRKLAVKALGFVKALTLFRLAFRSE